jgi:hypothetical protein
MDSHEEGGPSRRMKRRGFSYRVTDEQILRWPHAPARGKATMAGRRESLSRRRAHSGGARDFRSAFGEASYSLMSHKDD